MADEQTFIRKLVFRFVSKHIAGATLNSALNVTKALNSKGIRTTITFLNDHISDGVKARYNLNSYLQLTKQISRLSLNSAISVRLTQLGFNVSESTASQNMRKLAEVADGLRVPLWIEHESCFDGGRALRAYAGYAGRYQGVGIELPVRSSGIADIIARLPRKGCMVKLTAHSVQDGKAAKPAKKGIMPKPARERDPIALYTEYAKLLGKRHRVYIRENDEKTLYRIAARASVPKSNLIIELPLGYSGKWLARFARKRLNVDVYVPYGKDWVPYAINRLREGRIRNIARSVLNGESEVGFNGKDQGK